MVGCLSLAGDQILTGGFRPEQSSESSAYRLRLSFSYVLLKLCHLFMDWYSKRLFGSTMPDRSAAMP